MDVTITPHHGLGRKARSIRYKEIEYSGSYYVVGIITTSGGDTKFVIDKDDYPKMKDLSWHITSSYVAHNISVEGDAKALYLHNLVMNRLGHPGKGAKESVDHINRISLDNRKANLRVVTQSQQNVNKGARKRVAELPADSDLTAADLPRHVWYIKANGSHGDRFAIELKTEGISWKTTSSKTVSLKDKLDAAKAKLAEYYETYPHLNPDNDEKMIEVRDLTASYNAIIGLADEAASGE